LYYSGTDHKKWVIEAGLLSREPKSVIAKDVGISEAVLNRYATTFFDVEDKLDSPVYITSNLLKPSIMNNVMDKDGDILYKILSYFFGWKVFCEFNSAASLSGEAKGLMTASLTDKMLKNAWTAAFTIRIGNYNALDVITGWTQFKLLEKEAGLEEAQSFGMKLVENLLASCRMSVHKPVEQLEADEGRAFDPDKGFTFKMLPLPAKRHAELEVK
jgi:hypothetical protein